MTKEESRKAAKEHWRVRDDFGAIGTVVRENGPEHVVVKWDGEDEDMPVRYERINRE